MSKFGLQSNELSEDACVMQASTWARALTQSESRGPGDLTNAWRRLEHRYGIPSQTFWSLRYRRPNEIAASIWLRLGQAYAAECDRQMRRLQHEIEITKQIAGADSAAVRAAEALVDPNKRRPKTIIAAHIGHNKQVWKPDAPKNMDRGSD